VSAPAKIALNLALYIAHDDPGDPGRGNMPEEEGDLFIAWVGELCRMWSGYQIMSRGHEEHSKNGGKPAKPRDKVDLGDTDMKRVRHYGAIIGPVSIGYDTSFRGGLRGVV
jgi:hypothetical protein